MRVVVAPDKFKGSASAAQVAEAVATGLTAAAPGVAVAQLPVADGGEGTLAAALAAGFRRVSVPVAGPAGAPLKSALAVRGRTAVVEMAAASGLAVLPEGLPAPLTAGSLGTGQLVRAALDLGCTEVVVGIGGSACTDGGAGLLTALGARLLDARGRDLGSGGGRLTDLYRVDLGRLDPRLASVRVVLATDVDNPLLGPAGAAAVYGPQKGASASDVALLEAGLERWVAALSGVLGPRAATGTGEPGAGAAGGVGYGCLVALGAVRRPGVEVVLDLSAFPDHLAGADLVVAVTGRCALDTDQLRAAGIAAAYPLTSIEPDLDRCMRETGPLLERLAGRIARDFLLTPALRGARP
jgi:glycerate kinase